MASPDWKSLNRCSAARRPWNFEMVTDVANKLFDSLPKSAQDVLISGNYQGTKLIKLSGGIPTKGDLKANQA